jgi:preprotein translocase subunit SecD
MRRLIAYLTLVSTLILGVGLNIAKPIREMNSNLEYAAGREFIYEVSNKETEDGGDETLKEGAAEEVAAMMKERMDTFGVSEYQIATEGNTIVRVNATLKTELEYSRLRTLLNYDANFTVRVAAQDETDAILEDHEIFNDVKARIEYRGPHPFIVIPLSDPVMFKTKIVQVAQKIQEEKQTLNEGDDVAQIVEDAIIVVWSDYDPEKDVYAERESNNETKKKVFLSFDYRQMWWNEEETEIAVASQLPDPDRQDTNPDRQDISSYTTAQIKEATDVARYMVNVFNAGKTAYKIESIGVNTIYPPTVESLLTLGAREHIAMSRTFIALIVATVILSIVLVVMYRLPALSAISSLLLTVFGTLIIFNLVMVEFSTGALIGLLLAGGLALFSSVIYFHRFRQEVYRGRTFKKAHGEAIKKSTFLTLDAMVVFLALGVIAYFFGGASLTSFATMVMFSAPVAAITVLLHNAVTLYLLANNTSTQDNYKIYNINATLVPNVRKDEKPTYFGRFVESKPSKKAKLTGGIVGALSLASIVLLSVFAGINKTPLELTKSTHDTTRIYFRVEKNSNLSTSSEDKSPYEILKRIKYQDKVLQIKLEGDTPLYETHDYDKVEEIGESQITFEYVYYIYNLNGHFNGDEIVSYTDFNGDVNTGSTLSDALYNLATEVDADALVSVNPVTKLNLVPNTYRVGLIALITLGVTTLYMLFRHGISRASTFFVLGASSSLITLLFFMVTRITVPPMAAVGVLVATLISALYALSVYQSEKELHDDPLYRDFTNEELTERALTMSMSPNYALMVLLGLTFLNFVGIGPLKTAFVYASALLGILIATVVLTRLLNPTLTAFSKLYARIAKIELPKPKWQSKRAKHRASVKASSRKKSAEPEEAIFIGIND